MMSSTSSSLGTKGSTPLQSVLAISPKETVSFGLEWSPVSLRSMAGGTSYFRKQVRRASSTKWLLASSPGDSLTSNGKELAQPSKPQSGASSSEVRNMRASHSRPAILAFQSPSSYWNLALSEADYPLFYDPDLREHPDDYKELDAPIFEVSLYPGPPITNLPSNPHERVLLRACWKLESGKFLPMTFVVATGAPQDVHLCRKARKLLWQGKRVRHPPEHEAGPETMTIGGEPAMVQDTPGCHQPSNILGINLISRMSMRFFRASDGSKSVAFDDPLPYF